MFEPKPALIIVTGPPGAGKTTLGRRLAAELSLPYLAKDDIKESLFESLGWSDRDWSRKLGRASYDLLWHLIEVELRARKSAVAESNFYPGWHNERFRMLLERYGFDAIQIYCFADEEILLRRHRQRFEQGERHPGHVDHLTLEEVAEVIAENRNGPLDLDGTLISVDTGCEGALDWESLLRTVWEALQCA